jgi:hypothetical protein
MKVINSLFRTLVVGLTACVIISGTPSSHDALRSSEWTSRKVEKHLHGFSYDFSRFLIEESKDEFTIKVEFLLTKDGTAKDVRIIHSDIDSPELEKTLSTRILEWQWPPAYGDLTVRCSFIFRNAND